MEVHDYQVIVLLLQHPGAPDRQFDGILTHKGREIPQAGSPCVSPLVGNVDGQLTHSDVGPGHRAEIAADSIISEASRPSQSPSIGTAGSARRLFGSQLWFVGFDGMTKSNQELLPFRAQLAEVPVSKDIHIHHDPSESEEDGKPLQPIAPELVSLRVACHEVLEEMLPELSPADTLMR